MDPYFCCTAERLTVSRQFAKSEFEHTCEREENLHSWWLLQPMKDSLWIASLALPMPEVLSLKFSFFKISWRCNQSVFVSWFPLIFYSLTFLCIEYILFRLLIENMINRKSNEVIFCVNFRWEWLRLCLLCGAGTTQRFLSYCSIDYLLITLVLIR